MSQVISPSYMGLVDEFCVHTLSKYCLGEIYLGIENNAMASAVWTANRLIFLPLITQESLLVTRFWWLNGGTIDATSHTDIGIYTEDGQNKLGSTGAIVNSGASIIQQAVAITAFSLGANRRYWLTLGGDSSTQTYFRSNMPVTGMDYAGVKEQLSGYSGGLPTTITLATPTVAVTPFFGFTAKATM